MPFADFVTSTTHKTLRGPRGGIILAKAEFEKSINSFVFPGIQGGPLMHVIAAKAVAFLEALKPEFKVYQTQVIKNAQTMAESLSKRGFLVDLRPKGLTGKAADVLLGQAHITVNKNSIPNDPESPFVTSGIRIGSPAITTRGFKEKEADMVAQMIADILDHPNDEKVINETKAKVVALTAQFPVYGS
ncbi:MAG: serine hydroxymethyltransferase [Pseudomonadota bacterium]